MFGLLSHAGARIRMADPMWLMVMFDFPTKRKEEQRAANQYRNLLKDEGFDRIQLSVYVKYFVNSTGTSRVIGRLTRKIPAKGLVRILKISDPTWSSMLRFDNTYEEPPETKPEQLLLFG